MSMTNARKRKLTDRLKDMFNTSTAEIAQGSVTSDYQTMTANEIMERIKQYPDASVIIDDAIHCSLNIYAARGDIRYPEHIIVPIQTEEAVSAQNLFDYMRVNVCGAWIGKDEVYAEKHHKVLVDISGKLYPVQVIKYRKGVFKMHLSDSI